MVNTRVNGDHRHATMPNGWQCPLSPDRPVYDCPVCKQEAMQFHRTLADDPLREDFFHCCSCGSCWEM